MEKDDIVNEMSFGNRLCDFFACNVAWLFATSSIQMTLKISEVFLSWSCDDVVYDCAEVFVEEVLGNFGIFYGFVLNVQI